MVCNPRVWCVCEGEGAGCFSLVSVFCEMLEWSHVGMESVHHSAQLRLRLGSLPFFFLAFRLSDRLTEHRTHLEHTQPLLIGNQPTHSRGATLVFVLLLCFEWVSLCHILCSTEKKSFFCKALSSELILDKGTLTVKMHNMGEMRKCFFHDLIKYAKNML